DGDPAAGREPGPLAELGREPAGRGRRGPAAVGRRGGRRAQLGGGVRAPRAADRQRALLLRHRRPRGRPAGLRPARPGRAGLRRRHRHGRGGDSAAPAHRGPGPPRVGADEPRRHRPADARRCARDRYARHRGAVRRSGDPGPRPGTRDRPGRGGRLRRRSPSRALRRRADRSRRTGRGDGGDPAGGARVRAACGGAAGNAHGRAGGLRGADDLDGPRGVLLVPAHRRDATEAQHPCAARRGPRPVAALAGRVGRRDPRQRRVSRSGRGRPADARAGSAAGPDVGQGARRAVVDRPRAPRLRQPPAGAVPGDGVRRPARRCSGCTDRVSAGARGERLAGVLPGRGADGRRGRRPALDRVRPRHRLHRRTRAGRHRARRLVRCAGGDRGAGRRAAPLGQAARAGRRGAARAVSPLRRVRGAARPPRPHRRPGERPSRPRAGPRTRPL
ncbi:MAG: probable L-gulonolactone oxidase(), partial [uncultured Blastococcus sp.]